MTMQLRPTFAELLPLLVKLEWTANQTEPRSFRAVTRGWIFRLDTVALQAWEPAADGGYHQPGAPTRSHVWTGRDVREFALDVGEHLDGTAPDWDTLRPRGEHSPVTPTEDEPIDMKAELLDVAVCSMGAGVEFMAETMYDRMVASGEPELRAALCTMSMVTKTIAKRTS